MRWHLAAAALLTATAALVIHFRQRSLTARNMGEGPGRACVLPSRTCTADCDELVEMPLVGIGYFDYRAVEEFIPPTSSSFIRRDLMMLVQYASAKVACKASTWNTGHGAPIGLGDMSEHDGSTPGTVWGRARHPRNSHVHGLSIDIAYYQRDTPDNEPRPICRHFDARNTEQWRCLAPPTHLDAYRTALFIGALLEDPSVRVIGIDGLAAKPIGAAFDTLCKTKWIDPAACRSRKRIAFELRDTGRYWFRGHHNHLHLAVH